MTTEETTPAPQDGISNGTDPKPGIGATSGTDGISGTTTPQTDTLEDIKRELEAARVALKKANKDAGDHRKKAEELDKLKADQEATTLSTQQKLEKERDSLKAECDQLAQSLKQTKLAHAVASQAQKLGFLNPDDAKLFIDESQLNEDFSNVEDLLKEVLKTRSYLAGKPQVSTSGGATNPPRSTTDGSGGEITEQYVNDVMSGKIDWKTLTQDQRTRVLNWQTKNTYKF